MTKKNANFHAREDDAGQIARSERLREAVRRAGGNAHVAMRAQMPIGTLNNYIRGREMKAGAMIALAQACNVSLDWLASGAENGASVQPDPAFPLPKGRSNFVNIKYYDAEASAGFGRSPEEWSDGTDVLVSSSFLVNVLNIHRKSLFFIKIYGDSMEPTLKSGNTILVDYTPQNIIHSIYVIVLHGMLMVKRLSIKDTETFSVISDNPLSSSFDVPISRVCWGSAVPDAELRIIGRVVGRFEVGF